MGECQRPAQPRFLDGWNYCDRCGARNDAPCGISSEMHKLEIISASSWGDGHLSIDFKPTFPRGIEFTSEYYVKVSPRVL